MKRCLLLAIACLCMGSWAHAEVEIELNIQEGTAEMRSNVLAFLSLSRYTERSDLQPETMDRLAARIPSEVAAALEPLGYYESVATYSVQQADTEHWQVSVDITPGRAVMLSQVKISVIGEGQQDDRIQAELNNATVRSGQSLNHGSYDAYKTSLMRAANRSGYLEAHWIQSELLIDKAERRAEVTLILETGPRYYFGTIEIQQAVINPEMMQRFLRMRQGDPYDIELVLQTQYVLDDTLYFSTVDVSSAVPDPVTHTVAVNIKADANLKNSYTIAAGYGTDTQQRGRLSWDRRLINRAGHSAKLELIGSAIGHEASFKYVMPVRDVALEKLEFTVANAQEEFADVISYRNELKTGFTQALGSWQRVMFVKLTDEKSVYTDRESKSFLVIPGVSYATLPSYILGQAQRNYSLYMEIKGSPSSLGSGASFIQFTAQGERIFNVSQAWHLRLRGVLGASLIPDSQFSDLPASVRFFAGGDNSVRGYGLNELSPVDASGQRIGARNLIVGTTEFERDLPKNMRLAFFYDIGNAIDHFGDALKDSAGIGLRWHISVASLGLDVAQPITEHSRSPRLHLHLSTVF